MTTKAITLMARKRRATVPRNVKLGHRACEWCDEDEFWSEPLLGVGYAESYGAYHPDDVIEDEEPERAPIGFTY